jgi:hypothetical protein
MLIPMLLVAAAAIEPPPTCNAFVQVSNPKIRIVDHGSTLDLIVNGRKRVLDISITKPFDELIEVAFRQRKEKLIEEHYYSAYDVNTRYFDSILFKSDCHDKSE